MTAAARYDMTTGLKLVGSSLGRPRDDLADISDCLARRDDEKPWLLTILEPLLTKAPSPARCSPHCCYIRTVIFYHRPYIVWPSYPSRWRDGIVRRGAPGFAEYDTVQARLGWHDVVEFDGDEFEVGGGHVRWHHQRWWMHHDARRRARVLPLDRSAT